VAIRIKELKLIKKLFKSLQNKSRYSSSKLDNSNEGIISKGNALIELAKIFSQNDEKVVSSVALYINDDKAYFLENEDVLCERCIDSELELESEIVLIDTLSASKYIVYIDHAEEADLTLKYLDELSGNNLSKTDDFIELIETYKATGKYNAIANFISDSKIGPMPFDCIKSAGYSLANIDEGSDSLALILIKNDLKNKIEALTKSADLNFKFLG
jgi:hypothetical protein